MGRILVGITIVAITHGCGDKSAPAPTPTATGSDHEVAAPRRSAPALPALADAGLAPKLPAPIEDTFAAEERDRDWAPATERTIAQRFEKLRGAKLEHAECRASRCRVVIAGSEGDVGQTIADLEGPRGLHGFAKNVLLSVPSKRPDGTVELGLYVLFER